MKLRVLAGALALGVGASVLAPMTARADDRDRGWRDGRSGGRVRVERSYRDDRRGDRARSYRSYRSDRSYRYSRPYRSNYYRNHSYRSGYRGYGYGYYNDYYDGGYGYGYGYGYGSYEPYGYRPRVVVVPSYRYRGYRPLLGVGVAGPHFGVWLGF